MRIDTGCGVTLFGEAVLHRDARRADRVRYHVKIAGRLPDDLLDLFLRVSVTAVGDDTMLSTDVDRAGLDGLLQRIRMLGLELIEVRRARTPSRPAAEG